MITDRMVIWAAPPSPRLHRFLPIRVSSGTGALPEIPTVA